jgi:hypothetical protein
MHGGDGRAHPIAGQRLLSSAVIMHCDGHGGKMRRIMNTKLILI